MSGSEKLKVEGGFKYLSRWIYLFKKKTHLRRKTLSTQDMYRSIGVLGLKHTYTGISLRVQASLGARARERSKKENSKHT